MMYSPWLNRCRRLSDSAILMQAASDRRLVITNDKDFGELAFRSGQAHAGVLLLRLGDERAESWVAMVTSVLDRWGDRLLGAFTVATERGVRIRAIDQLP